VNHNRCKKLFDEGFPTCPALDSISTLNPVNEFDDTDGRECGVLVASCFDHTLEEALDGVATALGRNSDA